MIIEAQISLSVEIYYCSEPRDSLQLPQHFFPTFIITRHEKYFYDCDRRYTWIFFFFLGVCWMNATAK